MKDRGFTPLEKSIVFKRQPLSLKADCGMSLPSVRTASKRNSLTGFTPLETRLSFLLNKNVKISKRAVNKAAVAYQRSPKGDLSLTGFTCVEVLCL